MRFHHPPLPFRLAFQRNRGLFRPPPTHPRTETQDGGFPCLPAPFGSRFDAMGIIFDLTNPPLHRNARRGGFLAHHPPSARISTRWGLFSTSPTLPHTETRDGGLPRPPPPFGSRFDATGVIFDLTNPPSHRNMRHGVSSPATTLWLTFRCDGGYFRPHQPPLAPKHEARGFLTRHHPSARVLPRRRCFRPSLAPKHETGGFLTSLHSSAPVST